VLTFFGRAATQRLGMLAIKRFLILQFWCGGARGSIEREYYLCAICQ
jgi:hypothetical protein